MNILQINTLDTRGGAARVAYDLQNRFLERGHNASLFVGKRHSHDPRVFYVQQFHNNILDLIKRKFNKDIRRRAKDTIKSVFPTDIDLANIKGLLNSPQYSKADIIHCHNLHGNYFKLSALPKIARQKPIIWTLHDMWAITPMCAHAFDGALVDGFYQCPPKKPAKSFWHNEYYLKNKKRHIYKNTPMHIVVPAKWLKEKVEKSVLSGHPITVIPNGVDTAIYLPQPKDKVRQELKLPPAVKIITFVAHAGPANSWKGWQYMEQIMKYYHSSDVLFLCVGGDELAINTNRDKHIKFIPFISDPRTMAKYYSASDLLLFPSIAETFPLVILEAMACGLPIVSFDVGGVADAMVHKENGYLARYRDAEDLINGIQYIFTLSENEKKTMGEKSAERVKTNFSLELMAENYLRLYETAMDNYRVRAKI